MTDAPATPAPAVAALNELERRHQQGLSARYALCTMCIGVGQGIAMIIERTDTAE